MGKAQTLAARDPFPKAKKQASAPRTQRAVPRNSVDFVVVDDPFGATTAFAQAHLVIVEGFE